MGNNERGAVGVERAVGGDGSHYSEVKTRRGGTEKRRESPKSSEGPPGGGQAALILEPSVAPAFSPMQQQRTVLQRTA
ncbi:unnamed protein product [Arctogadus glacialis]